MSKMTRTEFLEKLKDIREAVSITGAQTYIIKNVNDNEIIFSRGGRDKTETIDVGELFRFYQETSSNRTTPLAKNYISGRVQSPSVAILNTLEKRINKARKNGMV